jgi:hypothetical protein
MVAPAILAGLVAAPAFAQAPPSFGPAQLDQLVARIALYPDPLLAQILAAATYPNDIPAAAQWADEHHYLTGQALANAISEDQLPWDPSVQALLPFPSVLDMMNSDMNWTTQFGNAFLAQQQDVMDTVQRQRGIARRSGYLTSNGESAGRGGFHPSTGGAMPGMRTPRGRTGIEAKSVLGRAANSRGDRPRKWTLPSLWEPAQSGFEANRPFSRRGNRYARRPHPQ